MKLQTLSTYRLKSKAVTTHETLTTPNGMHFSIFVSKNTDSIAQYYVVESHWDVSKQSKIVPLAHIQVSRTSGNIKFSAFQPKHWNLHLGSI